MENGLFEGICQLDATELRQIVLGLCLDPKNKEAVAKYIKLLPKEGATKPVQPQPSEPSTSSAQAAPNAENHSPENPKRHASRRSSVHTTPYTRQKCENCDFWFTAIDNADKACRFHPGKRESGLDIIPSYTIISQSTMPEETWFLILARWSGAG